MNKMPTPSDSRRGSSADVEKVFQGDRIQCSKCVPREFGGTNIAHCTSLSARYLHNQGTGVDMFVVDNHIGNFLKL